jgi:hypothetical protein
VLRRVSRMAMSRPWWSSGVTSAMAECRCSWLYQSTKRATHARAPSRMANPSWIARERRSRAAFDCPLTMVNCYPGAQRLHVAAESAAAPPLFEICRNIAVHTVDCGLGSANEDSRSCTGRRPRTERCGRARGSGARCTAAHLARHSCTADHLAGTLRARPLLGSDASVSRSSSGSVLTRVRASLALAPRALALAPRAQVPRLGCRAASCRARSAASKVRVRKLRGRA